MKITVIPKDKSREIFLKLHPPYLAKDLKPDWWKKLKPGSQKDSWILQHVRPKDWYNYDGFTAKRCPAIQDTLSTGLILPLWTKMFIGQEYDKNGTPNWTHSATTGDQIIGKTFVTTHMPFAFKGMDIGATAQGDILKIEMPYKIIVPEGYDIMYSDPFYHFRNDVRCLTGIVEADKWGYVSFPFSILNYECTVEPGTPFIHALIYKRENEKVELECRMGTEEEYEQNLLEQRDFMIKERDYRSFRDET
jgi:hypothetical protein